MATYGSQCCQRVSDLCQSSINGRVGRENDRVAVTLNQQGQRVPTKAEGWFQTWMHQRCIPIAQSPDRQPESLADGVQEPRQVAAVRNPAVRMKCDHQTNKAWLRGWEQRTNASTADFCDTGGAAELAVKALFPRMQGWAHALQVCCPFHPPCIPPNPQDLLAP